jgi:uncharacterized protein YggE
MKNDLATATAIAVAVCFASSAYAAPDGPEPRTVTVAGEAEVKVAPDEVILVLGVETINKELSEVKKAHDQRVRNVLGAVHAAGIAPKNVQTDYLSIEPDYRQESSEIRKIVGYIQRTTIVITLSDLAKFEKLLTATLQAGAEHVHNIEFRTTELRKHRDQARALAIRAAKEKAIALAGELGQKVGQPLSIREGQSGWWSSYRSWWGRNYQSASQNVVQNLGGASAREDGPIAPGMLSIRADVSITFELQ